MNKEVLRSSQNPRVKKLKKLMKSSAERNAAGLFPVEGIRMAREIPAGLIEEATGKPGAAMFIRGGSFEEQISGCLSQDSGRQY